MVLRNSLAGRNILLLQLTTPFVCGNHASLTIMILMQRLRSPAACSLAHHCRVM